jgi:hypothetical protein
LLQKTRRARLVFCLDFSSKPRKKLCRAEL